MKIFTCMKEVPGRETRFRINPEETWINESDLSYELNECDEYSIEEALRIKEKHGGDVTILNVGVRTAEKSIRKGLAMGCDRAVQVIDTEGRRSSPYAAAMILAKVLEQEPYDLVLAGTQSDDLSYAQTGVILAEMLGLPHATIVMEIEVDPEARTVKALREMESGEFQWVEMPLPAVLMVQAGSSQIRYPSLKGIMQAKKKEIRSLDLEEIDLDWADAPEIKIVRLYMPEASSQVEMLQGDTQTVVAALLEKLKKDVKVI